MHLTVTVSTRSMLILGCLQSASPLCSRKGLSNTGMYMACWEALFFFWNYENKLTN